MNKRTETNKGFTLIELLVVIAIIAILTGIILASLAGAKAKARDAQRISDLGQIQLALSLYYDRCGYYPTNVYSNQSCSTSNGTVSFSNFLSQVPVDPSTSGNYDYAYASGSQVNGGNPVDYVLHSVLEYNPSTDEGLSGMPAAPANTSWSIPTPYICTSGGKNYCITSH